MNFTQIPITINTAIKRMIDPDNTPYYPLKNSNRPEFIAENTVVLAVSMIGNDNNPIVLGAADTFDGGGDVNFIHTSATGTLSAGLTATDIITSLTAAVTPTDDVPDVGNIKIYNSPANWERIPYTAYNSATGVFTVDDHTMIYDYDSGDSAKVEENLMFYFDNDDIDIAGDWSDINRSEGKISIRITTLTDAFAEKLESALNGHKTIYLEIRRYGAGETTPATILLDTCYAQASVVNGNGEPGYTSQQFLTETSADARYLTGKSKTEMTLADDTANYISLDAIANIAGAKVLAIVDDGTNFEMHDFLIVHNGTSAEVADRYTIVGSRIDDITWSADIDSGNLRLIATLAGIGNNCTLKYRMINIED